MKLLISIPAYNEEKSIASVIRSIPPAIPGISETEIVVFDDGSTDRTAELAEAAGVRLVGTKENRGLSLTFQDIIRESLKQRADILVNIDADGQFNATDIPKLVQPIIDRRADAVTASRFIDQRITPAMPVMKRWGNAMVAKLISFLAQQKFYDVSCGFRAYSREALLNLNLFSKFTYTHETFLSIAFKGLRIWEIPVVVRGEREFGRSKVAHNLWRYGYYMVNTIFRTMLDYRPLKFFGWGGATFFFIGLVGDIALWVRLLIVHEITPYKYVGFVCLFLNIFGILLVIVGLLADMINRVRLTQERILYFEKRKRFDGSDGG